MVIEGRSKKLSVNIREKQRISREDSYQGVLSYVELRKNVTILVHVTLEHK